MGWDTVASLGLGTLNTVLDYASAKQQRDWQFMMSSEAHQREVADLKAAGLNPVLSAGGSGASTPVGGQTAPAHIGDNLPAMRQASSAKKLADKQVDLLESERGKNYADGSKSVADAEYQHEMLNNLYLEQGLTTARVLSELQGQKLSEAQVKGILAEIRSKQIQNQLTSAQTQEAVARTAGIQTQTSSEQMDQARKIAEAKMYKSKLGTYLPWLHEILGAGGSAIGTATSAIGAGANLKYLMGK